MKLKLTLTVLAVALFAALSLSAKHAATAPQDGPFPDCDVIVCGG